MDPQEFLTWQLEWMRSIERRLSRVESWEEFSSQHPQIRLQPPPIPPYDPENDPHGTPEFFRDNTHA